MKCGVVNAALKKKGFEVKSGAHSHVIYSFVHDGCPLPVMTHMSHNHQEIDDYLQERMAKQMKISKSEFLEIVSCKIGHDELVAHYVALGLLQKD
ncbi:hypothetical protein McpSp1_12860 [Methanocorpusculaceae archaeon Sp1]|nr:hypothetical protein [Methanocorpusculaceae archaeon Sp1]